MKSSKHILAIDFDGVVHDNKHPVKGRRMGLPIEGAKIALTRLQYHYKLIIFTIWKPESHKTIEDFMNYYELPFDEITNVKPQADWYIDDHGIQFVSWERILEQI